MCEEIDSDTNNKRRLVLIIYFLSPIVPIKNIATPISQPTNDVLFNMSIPSMASMNGIPHALNWRTTSYSPPHHRYLQRIPTQVSRRESFESYHVKAHTLFQLPFYHHHQNIGYEHKIAPNIGVYFP